MARKIKVRSIVCTVLIILSFIGCKRNDWYDWKEINEVYLQNNLRDHADIRTTSSGLQYRILADPSKTDQKPFSSCLVDIDYETKLINGITIDSDSSAYFFVYNLIQGVQEGLHLIHAHGEIELWIPYYLAYGKDGMGTEGYKTYVPPYSALYFRVKVNSSTAY